jgi:hypothetical protein
MASFDTFLDADYITPSTRFGITFGKLKGTANSLQSSAIETPGEIDYDSLNRRRFSDTVAFQDFYQSIADFVKARLGHPVVRVELADFQIATAIDEAISKLDYHAPDWCLNYCTFTTQAGIAYYKLPKFVMNNLQLATYKKTLLAINQQNGTLEFDFWLKYFQDFFVYDNFYVGDLYIMQSYLKEIRKVLGKDGMFRVVDGQFLFITPTPLGDTDSEDVVVMFKSLNSDTLHHYYISWIQRFSLAVCKGILGEIRGKYAQLPSPTGGAVLNGQALIQESANEQQILIEQLLTEIEEPPTFSIF